MTTADNGAEISYLDLGGGGSIAYRHQPGASPGIVFLPGFNSDMDGTKALALADWCRDRGQQFTRFDYSGHGRSSGEFSEGSIGQWCGDALSVIDAVTSGPQVLIGSSMGGWIMLLAALARPGTIAGLVGIASAPDFTERLYAERLGADQRRALKDTGYCELPNHYGDGKPHVIGRQLIEEAQNHLLLGSDIDITAPVRLLHGQADADVPWQLSMDIANALISRDVEIQLIKQGNHRLSEPGDLRRLQKCIESLLVELDEVD